MFLYASGVFDYASVVLLVLEIVVVVVTNLVYYCSICLPVFLAVRVYKQLNPLL